MSNVTHNTQNTLDSGTKPTHECKSKREPCGLATKPTSKYKDGAPSSLDPAQEAVDVIKAQADSLALPQEDYSGELPRDGSERNAIALPSFDGTCPADRQQNCYGCGVCNPLAPSVAAPEMAAVPESVEEEPALPVQLPAQTGQSVQLPAQTGQSVQLPAQTGQSSSSPAPAEEPCSASKRR
jgi:hypothetical protein